jgi:hypothetical protein
MQTVPGAGRPVSGPASRIKCQIEIPVVSMWCFEWFLDVPHFFVRSTKIGRNALRLPWGVFPMPFTVVPVNQAVCVSAEITNSQVHDDCIRLGFFRFLNES